jgi:TRAP-type C4-dicarboxylate transport system permease small subunit
MENHPMSQLNRMLDRILFWGIAVFSMSFFVVVLVSVLSRYILHAPILASIELSRLFFVWSCFLAAAITYRRKAHIDFTLLFDKASRRVKEALSLFIHVSILLFAALIFYHSIILSWLLWRTEVCLSAEELKL